jgi:shikimate dehydrogenase
LLSTSGSWSAFNTDVFGIQQAITSKTFSSVGILGTGATARSALVALEGRDVMIWGRNSQVSENLAKGYAAQYVDLDSCLDSDLVISTLPADALSGLISRLRPGVLLDVVYSRPSPNGFSGYISGLEMLIWQAIGQLRLLLNGNFEQLEDEDLLHELMMAATEMAE